MERRSGLLDELPVRDGFRMRGLAMSRIETFTDAAFAFALTLLVVSSGIPHSYPELIAAMRSIPAFAVCGLLLMVFWSGHHTWSRRYGLEDGPTIVLSCLLVFTVLVYVYPLRFLFGATLAWLGAVFGLPLSGESLELGGLRELSRLFVIYGVGFAAMCGCIVLLNLHAWRLRDELGLDALERFDTRAEIGAWAIVGSAGVLSVVVALVAPVSWAGLPGWAYGPLSIVMPLYSRRVRRRRAELPPR